MPRANLVLLHPCDQKTRNFSDMCGPCLRAIKISSQKVDVCAWRTDQNVDRHFMEEGRAVQRCQETTNVPGGPPPSPRRSKNRNVTSMCGPLVWKTKKYSISTMRALGRRIIQGDWDYGGRRRCLETDKTCSHVLVAPPSSSRRSKISGGTIRLAAPVCGRLKSIRD